MLKVPYLVLSGFLGQEEKGGLTMNFKDTHIIVQNYYFDHYSELSPDQRKAFFMATLGLPLVPESWHKSLEVTTDHILSKSWGVYDIPT